MLATERAEGRGAAAAARRLARGRGVGVESRRPSFMDERGG